CPVQGAQAKHLWRIGLPDQAAIHGFGHAAIGVGALEGVFGRHRQKPTYRIIREFSQQVVEVRTRQVRARRIVNQDPVIVIGAIGVQVQQRIEHRIRTLFAASDLLDTGIQRARQCGPIGVVHSQADHQALEPGMIEKAKQAVFNNREAAQLQVLLGTVCRHACANARGGNNCPEGRKGLSHRDNVTEPTAPALPRPALGCAPEGHRFQRVDQRFAGSDWPPAQDCRYLPIGDTAGQRASKAARETTS
nr:hypothetical protein [Tanacetum cinerariifolium]